MPRFHETRIGMDVLQGSVPKVVNAILGIHEELKTANRLKSQEIELMGEQNESLERLAKRPAEDVRLRDAEARLYAVTKMIENTSGLDKNMRDMLLDELKSDLV